MKTLRQLEPLSPATREAILQLESAAPMRAADVLALEPLMVAAIPAIGTAYGQLPGFYFKKALWMAQQGQHQDALHAIWLAMAITAGICLRGDDALHAQGTELMHWWLQALGYEGQDSLVPKIQIAESLFKAIEEQVTRGF
jgi:hypothetical protein